MKFRVCVILLASVFSLSSCAGVVNVQPQVNGLAVSGRFDQALKVLEQPSQYGKNNLLLYLLDKGLVFHLAGRYKESIDVFEQAKLEYDRLYTQSISKIAGSWLWNDYALPYRGEDFERVMLNIFQSLNFAALGDFEGALVEARDVDSILNAINQQYKTEQKNVYRDDAFARLLMGFYYEADGDLNNALISYRMAWTAYDRDYKKHYATSTPVVLKENLLVAAEEFGDFDLAQYRRLFADVKPLSWDEKRKMGEIIVVEYAGLSPMKLPAQVPVPLPDGYFTQITFPRYQKRTGELGLTSVVVKELASGAENTATSQLGQDISAIAFKNLKDRQVRVMAKAVLRPAGKYLMERGLQYSLEKDHGEKTAEIVKYAGTLYNMFSERADLRCWLTLPAQIRLTRFLVAPGEYDVTAEGQALGPVKLAPGQKKFLLVRTLK